MLIKQSLDRLIRKKQDKTKITIISKVTRDITQIL